MNVKFIEIMLNTANAAIKEMGKEGFNPQPSLELAMEILENQNFQELARDYLGDEDFELFISEPIADIKKCLGFSDEQKEIFMRNIPKGCYVVHLSAMKAAF